MTSRNLHTEPVQHHSHPSSLPLTGMFTASKLIAFRGTSFSNFRLQDLGSQKLAYNGSRDGGTRMGY